MLFSEETKLKIKPPSGKTWSFGYNSLLPDADDDGNARTDTYEVCLAVQAPRTAQDPTSTYAGLKFGVSPKGYIAVLTDAAGRVAIYDAHQDPAVPLLDWRALASPLPPAGRVNIIQVVVKAGSANVFVNGTHLDAPPIALGVPRSRIGVEVHSEEAKEDAWKLLWAAATEE